VDLNTVCTFERLLSGGKSGAFVYFVKMDGARHVLKYYPSVTVEANNERPFREVMTLCAMSGTPGFACALKFGCCRAPKDWSVGQLDSMPDIGLYVIMTLAPGVSLFALELEKLTRSQIEGIGFKLLGLLRAAGERLGGDIEHFDLHPDNIYIDTSKCSSSTIVLPDGSRQTLACPNVSIIDFDLLDAPVFHTQLSGFQKELPEQKAKKEGNIPVAERTVQFLQKAVGLPKTVALLAEARSLNNTDMRHWYVIMSALFLRAGRDVPLALCDSVQECLIKNSATLQGIKKVINPTENALYQAVLFGGQEFLQIWEDPYASTVYRMKGVFPTFDTTVFALSVSVPSDAVVSIGGLAFLYMPPKIDIAINTYQLANIRVTLNFVGTPAAAPLTRGLCITTANGLKFFTEAIIMLLIAARDEGPEGMIQRAVQNLTLSVKRDSARLPTKAIFDGQGLSVKSVLSEINKILGFGPLLCIRTIDISKMGQTLNVILICDKKWGHGYSLWIKILQKLLTGVSYSTSSINEELFQISMIIVLKETDTPCTTLQKLRKARKFYTPMSSPPRGGQTSPMFYSPEMSPKYFTPRTVPSGSTVEIEAQKDLCTDYIANILNISIGWVTQSLFKMRQANMKTSVESFLVYTDESVFFAKPLEIAAKVSAGAAVNVSDAFHKAAENTVKRIRQNVKKAVKAYAETTDKVLLLKEIARYVTLDPFEIIASLVLPEELAYATIEARKANSALNNANAALFKFVF
jgi:hypothetical protein